MGHEDVAPCIDPASTAKSTSKLITKTYHKPISKSRYRNRPFIYSGEVVISLCRTRLTHFGLQHLKHTFSLSCPAVSENRCRSVASGSIHSTDLCYHRDQAVLCQITDRRNWPLSVLSNLSAKSPEKRCTGFLLQYRLLATVGWPPTLRLNVHSLIKRQTALVLQLSEGVYNLPGFSLDNCWWRNNNTRTRRRFSSWTS